MHFTKMHGIGNDYVYVDCTKEQVKDPEAVAKYVSDRHFGIGSDGLILIKPSDIADFEMDMYNADGSRGKMCGNGIRCVGKYVYDHGLTDKTTVKIATGSGIKTLVLTVENGKVALVRVNMGTDYRVTCVSMGNPHCITFMESQDDVENLEIEKIGPKFENHEVFPDRVNTEFVYAQDEHNIRMRVWERGSGETWACGTGACATAVAAILCGKAQSPVTIHLNGGDLFIEWNQEENIVFMTGPATEVFEGDIDL